MFKYELLPVIRRNVTGSK